MKNQNQDTATTLTELVNPYDGNPYPSPTTLADELDQVTGDIEERVNKIGEMIDAIRDRHETRSRAGLETDAENAETREILAGALVTLEKCLAGVDAVSRWTGADCL